MRRMMPHFPRVGQRLGEPGVNVQTVCVVRQESDVTRLSAPRNFFRSLAGTIFVADLVTALDMQASSPEDNFFLALALSGICACVGLLPIALAP